MTCLPSGDHVGRDSFQKNEDGVSRCWSLPSPFITQRLVFEPVSRSVTNRIRPSGPHFGVLSDEGEFVSRRSSEPFTLIE